MGIVNVTPDSFSDGGDHFGHAEAIAHGQRLRDQGATILDVGGESTRPGAQPVGSDEELRRVLPVVEALAANGAVVSIDTYRADVAAQAISLGATIVNDVSGGLADGAMFDTVASSGAEIVIGHWRGPSSDMYAAASYASIGAEVAAELSARADAAIAAGIAAEKIVVDPGIGFAKAGEQNWRLLREIDAVLSLGFRVLIGTSRKRFFQSALGENPARERLDLATAVTSALAVDGGAWGVRVHDVAATRDAIATLDAWRNA
ncbi:dihydropteroate synthase [Microbacterium amylolyticum]|nr:dihydropteroate synthase [Microbacterium amylolyticum]